MSLNFSVVRKLYKAKIILEGMTDEKMNHDRAEVYLEKKIKVHVSKSNGIFYNGMILEVLADSFFIADQKDGRQLIFFKELTKPITEYTEE